MTASKCFRCNRVDRAGVREDEMLDAEMECAIGLSLDIGRVQAKTVSVPLGRISLGKPHSHTRGSKGCPAA